MEIKLTERIATVKEETDVLVVGGGPAGIGAAIAAARNGLKVVLLEKRGFLGGNVTCSSLGYCNHFLQNTPFKAGGIYAEMEKGYKCKFGRGNLVAEPNSFNTEYLKIFLDDFVLREGVKVYFHSFVNDVVMKGDTIEYAVIQTKQGPVAFKPRMVVDATGDGDVAYFAGVPFEYGREKDGKCQPGTLMFALGGVDVDFFRKLPNNVHVVSSIMRNLRGEGAWSLSHQRVPSVCGLTDGGIVQHVNYNEAYGVDATDFGQASEAEINARKQIEEFIEFARKTIDGMQTAELAYITPEMCFRESRRIEGHYKLTYEDIENNRRFDDGIALFPRFYDLHSIDGNWLEMSEIGNNATFLNVRAEPGREFHIPYRSLVPVKTDNLLITGRCIYADPVAESCIRQVYACMETGQAAGNAMYLALRDNVAPGKINVPELREMLQQQSATL